MALFDMIPGLGRKEKIKSDLETLSELKEWSDSAVTISTYAGETIEGNISDSPQVIEYKKMIQEVLDNPQNEGLLKIYEDDKDIKIKEKILANFKKLGIPLGKVEARIRNLQNQQKKIDHEKLQEEGKAALEAWSSKQTETE